ncbi:immunoglobulin lambda-1 light chain-like isoform X2, partial [Clarias magur]
MFWFKVDQRTGEMIVSKAVHTDKQAKLCRGFIYNTSTADSGTYYCSVKHSFIAYMGNGSTVTVTERSSRPNITVYVPNVSAGPSVSVQCVVMGVVPSEVSVSWIIGESEMTGWTESGWTHTNALAEEYTRAHISVPSEKWTEARTAECVVEVDGRRFSKSVRAGSSQLCLWLMFLCSGVAFVVIVVVSITFAALHSDQRCLPTRQKEDREILHN